MPDPIGRGRSEEGSAALRSRDRRRRRRRRLTEAPAGARGPVKAKQKPKRDDDALAKLGRALKAVDRVESDRNRLMNLQLRAAKIADPDEPGILEKLSLGIYNPDRKMSNKEAQARLEARERDEEIMKDYRPPRLRDVPGHRAPRPLLPGHRATFARERARLKAAHDRKYPPKKDRPFFDFKAALKGGIEAEKIVLGLSDKGGAPVQAAAFALPTSKIGKGIKAGTVLTKGALKVAARHPLKTGVLATVASGEATGKFDTKEAAKNIVKQGKELPGAVGPALAVLAGSAAKDVYTIGKQHPAVLGARAALGKDVELERPQALYENVGKPLAKDLQYLTNRGPVIIGYDKQGKPLYRSKTGGVTSNVGEARRGIYAKMQERPLDYLLWGRGAHLTGGRIVAKAGTRGALGARGRTLELPGHVELKTRTGVVHTKRTSSNPIRRREQEHGRQITTALTGKIESRIGRELPIVGEHARATRGLTKQARRQEAFERDRVLRPFERAFQGLSGPEKIAVVLSAQGLKPSEFGRFTEAQRAIAKRRAKEAKREGLTEVAKRLEGEGKDHKVLGQYVARVDDELYDAVDTRPELARARQAARDLVDMSGDLLAQEGALTPTARALRPLLALRIVRGARFGDVKYKVGHKPGKLTAGAKGTAKGIAAIERITGLEEKIGKLTKQREAEKARTRPRTEEEARERLAELEEKHATFRKSFYDKVIGGGKFSRQDVGRRSLEIRRAKKKGYKPPPSLTRELEMEAERKLDEFLEKNAEHPVVQHYNSELDEMQKLRDGLENMQRIRRGQKPVEELTPAEREAAEFEGIFGKGEHERPEFVTPYKEKQVVNDLPLPGVTERMIEKYGRDATERRVEDLGPAARQTEKYIEGMRRREADEAPQVPDVAPPGQPPAFGVEHVDGGFRAYRVEDGGRGKRSWVGPVRKDNPAAAKDSKFAASEAEKIAKLTDDELQDIVSKASSRTGGQIAWSNRTRAAFAEIGRRHDEKRGREEAAIADAEARAAGPEEPPEAKLTANQRQALDALPGSEGFTHPKLGTRGGLEADDVAELTGMSRTAAQRALYALTDKGLIKYDDSGYYRPTSPKGKPAPAPTKRGTTPEIHPQQDTIEAAIKRETLPRKISAEKRGELLGHVRIGDYYNPSHQLDRLGTVLSYLKTELERENERWSRRSRPIAQTVEPVFETRYELTGGPRVTIGGLTQAEHRTLNDLERKIQADPQNTAARQARDELYAKKSLDPGEVAMEGLAADADLFHFPHLGKLLREGQIPLARAGAGPPAKPGISKLNQGIRVLASRWLPTPQAWRDGFLHSIAYAHARARGAMAFSIGKQLNADASANPGWYFVRLRRENAPRAVRERGDLHAELEQYKKGGGIEDWLDANLVSKKEGVRDRWLDEGDEVRQISPSDFREIFGEFKGSNRFIRLAIDRPIDFWRTLTLTYRPAWVVNNIVGQTLLYTLHHVSPKGAAAYAQAIVHELEQGRGKDVPYFPEELRHGGFVMSETVSSHGVGQIGRLRAAEGKVRDKIQAFNAAASDAVPRRAAWYRLTDDSRKLMNKVYRTSYTHDQFLDMLERSARPDAPDSDLRRLHDDLVQQVFDELVDFRNLSEAERKIVRRVVPFYSWIKGISLSTARLGINHPLRAELLAMLGQQGIYGSDKAFGEAGKLLRSVLPLGKEVDRGRGGERDVLSTVGLNPLQTPGDVVRHASALVSQGETGDNPFLMANPIFQTAVEAITRRQLYSQRPIESRFGQLGIGVERGLQAFPEYATARKILFPDSKVKGSGEARPTVPGTKYFGIPSEALRFAGVPLKRVNVPAHERIVEKQRLARMSAPERELEQIRSFRADLLRLAREHKIDGVVSGGRLEPTTREALMWLGRRNVARAKAREDKGSRLNALEKLDSDLKVAVQYNLLTEANRSTILGNARANEQNIGKMTEALGTYYFKRPALTYWRARLRALGVELDVPSLYGG